MNASASDLLIDGGSTDLYGDAADAVYQTVVIGRDATGDLGLHAGADFTSNATQVGSNPGSLGTVTVSGAASGWQNANALEIGVLGTGSLSVTGGAIVGTGSGFLGFQSTGNGLATISGTGTKLIVTNNLEIGAFGKGELRVVDGGVVEGTNGYLGFHAGATANVVVSGSGSLWDLAGNLELGAGGNGTVALSDGGRLEATNVYMGFHVGASGTATVSGIGSILALGGNVEIGSGGRGTLVVTDGGSLTGNAAYVGLQAPAVGSVTISGTGSAWIAAATPEIGAFGTGSLSLSDGGRLQVDNGNGTVRLAVHSGSSGIINIGAASDETAIAAGTLQARTVRMESGSAAIRFNHTDTAYDFTAEVTGQGAIEAYGGSTHLSGNLAGFAGDIAIHGGRLSVNDSFNNTIRIDGGLLGVDNRLDNTILVLDGGTIGGTGTVENVTLSSGSTVAPGNSIGTLTVDGNLTLVSGSRLATEVDASGNTDLLHVTGTATIDAGATLALSAANGSDTGANYTSGTTYTVLTADRGLTGTFASVTDTFAYLDASLVYDANNARMTLTRTPGSTGFANLVTGHNGHAAAQAVETLDSGSPLYQAVLSMGDGEPEAAFARLSGEDHLSHGATQFNRSHMSRDVISDRIDQAFGGIATDGGPALAYLGRKEDPVDWPLAVESQHTNRAWASAHGGWSRHDGGENATFTTTGGGLLFGADTRMEGDWLLGVAGGYGHDRETSRQGYNGSIDSYSLATYAGTGLGTASIRLGALYTLQRIDSRRDIAFSSFSDRLEAGYDAHMAQIFSEASWRIDRDLAQIEPYAGLAWVGQWTDGFTEHGGAAALTAAAAHREQVHATLGMRFAYDITAGQRSGRMTAGLGWRHALGDLTPSTVMSLGGSAPFTVTNEAITRNTALIDLGFSLDLGDNTQVSLGYHGVVGDGGQTHRALTSLSARF